MITIGPPLFAAPFASLIGKLIGAKTILHIQDYEVDAAFNFGLIRGNLLKNLALSIEKRILLSFNRVSTISLGMMRLAQEKGVAKSRLLFFPNWIDMKPFMDTSSDTINARSPQVLNYRELLKIPENSIIALYSGAMGIKQALHLLAVVAKLFQKDSALSQSVYFIFCGEGPGKSDLEIACSGLRNVFFLDFQPNKHLPTLLMQADIHLLPQRNDVSDLMMPSKLTGMLASGRPIVACAKKETDLEVIIKSCGIAVSPDNPYEFYAAVRNLALDIRLREHLGANGKNYAIKNLSKENILCKFETEIQNLASKTYQS
jgi:colanic acid biosynthesis glycosyl transferase WcaI